MFRVSELAAVAAPKGETIYTYGELIYTGEEKCFLDRRFEKWPPLGG